MSDVFLPENYQAPQSSGGNYARLEDGANTFRPLGSAITGWEGWKTHPDGTRKPVRAKKREEIAPSDVDNLDELKHFWAFPVYNYQTKTVQILEIKQRTIQAAVQALVENEDWGSPVGPDGYDIVITRSGEALETTYSVMPKPKKQLEEGIMQTYEDMHIKLDALFTGDDPFGASEQVDVDDVPDF